MYAIYLCTNWAHPNGSWNCCGGLPVTCILGLSPPHFSQKQLAFSGPRAIMEYLTTRWSLNRSQAARYEHTRSRTTGADGFLMDSFCRISDNLLARILSLFKFASRAMAFFLSSTSCFSPSANVPASGTKQQNYILTIGTTP